MAQDLVPGPATQTRKLEGEEMKMIVKEERVKTNEEAYEAERGGKAHEQKHEEAERASSQMNEEM